MQEIDFTQLEQTLARMFSERGYRPRMIEEGVELTHPGLRLIRAGMTGGASRDQSGAIIVMAEISVELTSEEWAGFSFVDMSIWTDKDPASLSDAGVAGFPTAIVNHGIVQVAEAFFNTTVEVVLAAMVGTEGECENVQLWTIKSFPPSGGEIDWKVYTSRYDFRGQDVQDAKDLVCRKSLVELALNAITGLMSERAYSWSKIYVGHSEEGISVGLTLPGASEEEVEIACQQFKAAIYELQPRGEWEIRQFVLLIPDRIEPSPVASEAVELSTPDPNLPVDSVDDISDFFQQVSAFISSGKPREGLELVKTFAQQVGEAHPNSDLLSDTLLYGGVMFELAGENETALEWTQKSLNCLPQDASESSRLPRLSIQAEQLTKLDRYSEADEVLRNIQQEILAQESEDHPAVAHLTAKRAINKFLGDSIEEADELLAEAFRTLSREEDEYLTARYLFCLTSHHLRPNEQISIKGWWDDLDDDEKLTFGRTVVSRLASELDEATILRSAHIALAQELVTKAAAASLPLEVLLRLEGYLDELT